MEECRIQTKPWFNPSYIEIQGECNTKVSIIDFQDIRYVYFNGNFVRFIYQRNVHTWVVTRQTHSTWKKTMCEGYMIAHFSIFINPKFLYLINHIAYKYFSWTSREKYGSCWSIFMIRYWLHDLWILVMLISLMLLA